MNEAIVYIRRKHNTVYTGGIYMYMYMYEHYVYR